MFPLKKLIFRHVLSFPKFFFLIETHKISHFLCFHTLRKWENMSKNKFFLGVSVSRKSHNLLTMVPSLRDSYGYHIELMTGQLTASGEIHTRLSKTRREVRRRLECIVMQCRHSDILVTEWYVELMTIGYLSTCHLSVCVRLFAPSDSIDYMIWLS